jgi:hypothetical protein
MKWAKLFLVGVLGMSACGCAHITAPAPQPSMANVNAAKALASTVNVGSFKLAAGLSPSIDESISVRGSNTLKPPGGTSFSNYLREVLITELRAGNKLDEASRIIITGELTKSELDAGMTTGTATVGARFVATRADGVCFDKELAATGKWESSFLGAVAVPAAFNHYTALYPELVGKLVAESEFAQRCMNKQ